MTEQIHIGYTGTRHGMSSPQATRVIHLLSAATNGLSTYVAHHGLCVGGDEQFHDICRASSRAYIVGHPGPDWPAGALCARITDCNEVLDPMPHMKRNASIVAASKVMIAAPYEDTPQPKGGTWRTIGMARKALARGLLKELHVVGRSGELLDYSRWPP